jgi:hypothetical protein
VSRSRLAGLAIALAATGALSARSLALPEAPRAAPPPEVVRPVDGAPSERAPGALARAPRLFVPRLDRPSALRAGLLASSLDASIERLGSLRRYSGGQYGTWRERPWFTLSWSADAGEPDRAESEPLLARPESPRLDGEIELLSPALGPTFAWTGPSLGGNGFEVLWQPPPKVVRDWRCRRRPVTIARLGGETDTFPLLRCDGSIAPEAIDRLSILMRPPNVPDPGDLLPDEPSPSARSPAEWLPRIRVVQPRLVWLLQSIADAFPWKPIHIYSGYRPAYDEKHRPGAWTHASLHGMGRALDIKVLGVPNAQVFQVCRKLGDVGCGFYPNSPFVHVDVRKPGTGHALWIDVSGPSEAPKYVDSWPGVVEKGGMVWVPGGEASTGPVAPPVMPSGMGGAQVAP